MRTVTDADQMFNDIPVYRVMRNGHTRYKVNGHLFNSRRKAEKWIEENYADINNISNDEVRSDPVVSCPFGNSVC